MKLVFAIKRLDSSAGGAERVFCTVCSELVARGHDVIIVTFDSPGGMPFYPLSPAVRRIELGIGHSDRNATVGETLRRVVALRRILVQEKPHVATGFMHSMFVPLAFASLGTAVPVLGSEHTVPEHYRTRPLQYLLCILAAPFMSRLTVLSEAIRRRYPAVIRKRMVVVPNPVAPATGQAEPGAEKQRHVLLNVGRLDAMKDHATLVRAFAAIALDFPDWELRIFGEGPERRPLEELVAELGLAGRVHLPGVTPDIGAEYRAADIFVTPSRYEAFGLVTAEAMSCGLPVVGFADCPGTNELIQDGTTGLLVQPGSDRVGTLADALRGLLSEPGLREALGQAGCTAVGHEYSVRHVCDQWEKLLESVCKNSSAAVQAGRD